MITIVLFTSTKGHFGYKGCYLETAKQFQFPYMQYEKLAHIKFNKDLPLDMTENLSSLGFLVYVTEGEWSHNSSSHAVEYYKDMEKMLSLVKTPYVFVCEDDWIIGKHLCGLLIRGADFLDDNRGKLSIRVLADTDRDQKDLIRENDYICTLGPKSTPYGSTFTFQPTLVRTSEWYHSVRFINKKAAVNRDFFNLYHCELVSGEMLRLFSDDRNPFCCFNPLKKVAKHIGTKEYADARL